MNEKIINITYNSKSVNGHSVYKFENTYKYVWEKFDGTEVESLNTRSVTIHQQPTGNCQLSTICTFANISCFNDESLQKLFRFIYDKTYVKLLLFDVNKEYVDRLEKLFSKEYICFKNKYTSTNKSKMCLFGIDLRSFVLDITPKEEVKNDSVNNLANLVEEDSTIESVDSDFEEVVQEQHNNNVSETNPHRNSYRSFSMKELENVLNDMVREKKSTIQKVTKVKPKKDSYVIHHVSPQQREQIRNISNRHKF